jgi:hypothetical protein
MKTKKDSMFLLNAEGDILRAEKTQSGLFRIIDQWNISIAIWNSNSLFNFTRGKIEITDSKGRVWNYGNEPGNMKPDLRKLDEFIGIDTTNYTY